MNLNKCPYNLSEDYEMIFDYLNESKKLLFALFLLRRLKRKKLSANITTQIIASSTPNSLNTVGIDVIKFLIDSNTITYSIIAHKTELNSAVSTLISPLLKAPS